jgi:two-component system CheB/CheR fusion protein
VPETSLSSDPEGRPANRFAVVGIGASAGGLSALLGVLEQLPAGCDMAFVVALHLPGKDSESALPILAGGPRCRWSS